MTDTVCYNAKAIYSSIPPKKTFLRKQNNFTVLTFVPYKTSNN